MPYKVMTRDARHPLEIATLVGSGGFGGVGVAFSIWPGSIVVSLGEFSSLLQDVWGLLLLGGAIVALLGISMKKRENGALLEQVGAIAISASLLTYSAALFTQVRGGGLGLSIFTLCISIGFAVRWWLIERQIREAIALDKAKKSLMAAQKVGMADAIEEFEEHVAPSPDSGAS